MRICYVADYRSPIARQWIDGVAALGHDVRVISSRPTDDDGFSLTLGLETIPLGPAALLQDLRQRRRGRAGASADVARAPGTGLASSANPHAQRISRLVGPYELRRHVTALRRSVLSSKPDVVHAMRLPYEGMASAMSLRQSGLPLVTSIWGNDLTLHAPGSRAMRRATRTALGAVTALHADCHRDIALAHDWGLPPTAPTLVVPSAGGINRRSFFPGASPLRRQLGIPDSATVIVNARGVREYVDLPSFFAAASMVLESLPQVHVICVGLRGHPASEQWLATTPHASRVHLLPTTSHEGMPDVFRAGDIVASLTAHDGTPNSLLEALATGCFPVVGPVASVLEWVTDGENALVVPYDDAPKIAATISRAVQDRGLRDAAALINAALVDERADLHQGLRRAIAFYESLAPGAA